jgi:hypothetical protein
MVCRVPEHRPRWYVQVRRANYSAFNGGHRTPSAYSAIRCSECGSCWRTKAKYVDTLPDEPQGETSSDR